jgi:hypothetical protein
MNAVLAHWKHLREERQDLADVGRGLFYQFGVGLAFLGTVRTDGGPRLHPVCPIVTDEGLYVLVVPSPKRDDLHRDRRYALHSFPCADNEDAFYVVGEAVLEPDDASIRSRFLAERSWTDTPPPDWHLQQVFELLIERVLYTKTLSHGDFNPVHTVWRPA